GAAARLRHFDRPAHHGFADATAARLPGCPHALDQSPRRALAGEAGDESDLETAEHRSVLFRDHDRVAAVALDGAEDTRITVEVVHVLAAAAKLVVGQHGDEGR